MKQKNTINNLYTLNELPLSFIGKYIDLSSKNNYFLYKMLNIYKDIFFLKIGIYDKINSYDINYLYFQKFHSGIFVYGFETFEEMKNFVFALNMDKPEIRNNISSIFFNDDNKLDIVFNSNFIKKYDLYVESKNKKYTIKQNDIMFKLYKHNTEIEDKLDNFFEYVDDFTGLPINLH